MNIGINALNASGFKSGIARYTINLIKAILCLDKINKYYIFVGEDSAEYFTGLNANIIKFKKAHKPVIRIILEQLALPYYIKKYHIELLHSTAFSLPVYKACKYVLTIPDVVFKVMPETILVDKLLYYNLLFPYSMKKADKIISISENTKRDIIKYFEMPANKITVTLLGVEKEFKKEDKIEADKRLKKFNLPDKFLLFVGSLEPRKNLGTLIKAYSKIKDRINLKLVITGAKGWKYSGIFDTISLLELEKDVIFTEFVEDELMPFLYNKAELFIFPPLYEGFGLPILEAMACGTTVIASRNSSIEEVAGDAAQYFTAEDENDIANNILEVLKNKPLKSELAAKGLIRVKEFTWEKTALKTIAVYESINL